MHWITGYKEIDAIPNRPASAALEEFCDQIGRLYDRGNWAHIPPDLMAEEIAERFRRRFGMPIPVAPHLSELLQRIDVETAQCEDYERPTSLDWNPSTGQWQIWMPQGLGRRKSVRVLEGIFLVLFWRLCCCSSWWNEWRARFGVDNPRRLAACFAFAVVLPPSELRDRARACGLNIWQLADAFAVTPSACFYSLRRYVRFPFAYFLARLDFCVRLDQQQLFFDTRAVRAQVWAKFLAQPQGAHGECLSGLEALRQFPRQESIVEVKGFLYEAIRNRRPIIWTARKLLGVALPQPACFVARPNSAGTQLLVQSVPVGCHAFLMDRALREQQAHIRVQ